MKKIIFALALLLLIACEENIIDNIWPPDNSGKVSISQGVWGNVWFWEGNFMPSTDNSSGGKVTPVVREIYIHEAATWNDVIRSHSDYSFIKSIKTNLVKKVVSDKNGFFQTQLNPGKYSFFVKEDSLYFANETDGDGYLMFAEVADNKVSKRQININYKAAY